MKFSCYKKGSVVKNCFGENITLIGSRKVINAKTYKEAEKNCFALGYDYVCYTNMDTKYYSDR